MLRPSPNHGTQRLPNDDDDDSLYAFINVDNCERPLTDVVYPSYISCVTLIYSSPTFFFLSAHHMLALGHMFFSRSTKMICIFFSFFLMLFLHHS